MVEVTSQQAEAILTREQLREIERYQSRFAELERELSSMVDDFISVLNRHYFNRENGYVEQQQQNLREVVALQARLDKLGTTMSAQAGELKNYMVQLQNSLHGLPAKPAAPAEEKAGGDQAAKKEETPAAAIPEKEAGKQEAADKEKATSSDLVNRSGKGLADGSQQGGEISLKLLFDELHLAEPVNSGVLNEISQALRKLLYDRKLVGYSKTSFVFGRDRSIDQLLEDLAPIFIAESLCGLMRERRLIEPGETERLKVACNDKRELIYLLT
ncbi:MAG: hypothetical protein V1794_10910 [Candidatus Glassbacteria bacterium]